MAVERPVPGSQRDRALELRRQYINANEHVARLYTRGAPASEIARAERERDRLGDRWYRAAQDAAKGVSRS